MTMPDERMRAVGWGSELLEQIASDTALPDTIIGAAKRVALTYPTSQALEDRLRSGAAGFPPEWTSALLEALELFDEMRVGALGSPSTRSDLVYTMRHFPDQMTIRAMSRASRLQEWLQQSEERERIADPSSPLAQAPHLSAALPSMLSPSGHLADDSPLRSVVPSRFAERDVLTDSLDDGLAVIRAAAVLSGDLKKAAAWYFADRIDVFDGLTAEALVLQGRARDVLRYIGWLEAGISG